MKIRRANAKDLPAIERLGKNFYDMTIYAKHGVEYDTATVLQMLKHLVGGHGIVQVAEEDGQLIGFILVALFPFPFNTKITCATEMAFYVDPAHQKSGTGRALMKSAENVARQLGAKFLSMVTLDSVGPEKVEPLYKSLGYERNEVAYTKDL